MTAQPRRMSRSMGVVIGPRGKCRTSALGALYERPYTGGAEADVERGRKARGYGNVTAYLCFFTGFSECLKMNLPMFSPCRTPSVVALRK